MKTSKEYVSKILVRSFFLKMCTTGLPVLTWRNLWKPEITI